MNCGSGQSVASALAQAQGRAGSVTIAIAGICAEQVQIQRDDVTLQAGWGILCAGPPAVAQIAPSGPFTLTGSSVFSNIGGQISCPGNVVP